MSLIHEALKKVERQRQLGQAPTLNTPAFGRRRRARWPWLLALVVVLVAAASGWFWYQQRSIGEVPRVAAMDKASASSQPTLPPVSAPGVQPDQAAPTSPVVQANDRRNPPNRAPAPRQQPAPAAAPTRPSAETTLAPVTPLPPAPQSATPTPQQGNQPAQAPTSATLPAPTPDATQPSAVQPKPAGTELPMYWQLSYAERKDLPPFKISMHMYSELPADRFVILNGVRQAEGDTLSDGTKLISINPDSITVEKNGKRFLVPRQGSD